MKILSAILCLLCCSCSSLTDFETTEIVWQTAHIADIGQTVAIVKNPECHYETGLFTGYFFGDNPTEKNVYTWGLATALGHYFIFNWFNDHLSKNVGITTRLIDTGMKINTIKNNHAQGLRPNGKTLATMCRKPPKLNTTFEWKF